MVRIRTVIKTFIRDTAYFIWFIYRLIRSGSFSNPSIKEKYSGIAAVLANGPSLKEVIPRLTSRAFDNTDFIVMNFFAFDEIFFKIKPKHYCFSDPMFFREIPLGRVWFDKVKKLYKIFQEKVDWEMAIYIPRGDVKAFRVFSGINKNNISIIGINTVAYTGFESLRNFFYKKGLSCPPLSSVVILAIFVGLNIGYSDIKLYGADHNYFESLCVNDDNQLCLKNTHFYESEEDVLEPVRLHATGEIIKVSFYLWIFGLIFIAHDQLSNYAAYCGKRIINCTKGSMIDSYERAKNQ